MQLLDAAYNVVHDYPGGATSLAPRLGKSPTTLNHEVTGTGTAKFGLLDACKTSQLSGDLRILQSFAEACGQMCVPLPNMPVPEGNDVMRAMAESSREFAELCQEVCQDMADGAISDNELGRIETARSELIARLAQLGDAIRSLNQARKPGFAKTGGAL